MGDRVLLLLPSSNCKFLAHWQGPYTNMERVSPVNYYLQQPGKGATNKLYPINILKKRIKLVPVLSTLSVPHSLNGEQVHHGEESHASPKTRTLRTRRPVWGHILNRTWVDTHTPMRNQDTSGSGDSLKALPGPGGLLSGYRGNSSLHASMWDHRGVC